MAQEKAISGFSKLDAAGKLKWLQSAYNLPDSAIQILNSHLHADQDIQAIYNEFSENTVSNFYVPYGLAPNFLINNKWYVLPMAIEESSVVAAASHAAKFWSKFGGFQAEVIGQVKIGQVHFFWSGEHSKLMSVFENKKEMLIQSLDPITESMRKRGGGIKDITIRKPSETLEHYYQLYVEFLTGDAMGANFINTVLEKLAKDWEALVHREAEEGKLRGDLEITMSILSNYTPECLVKIYCETHVSELGIFDQRLSGAGFGEKFVRACKIANEDSYRAVTHNKGIFNGVDALVIASGNDFRAVEACGHAYAARDGKYRSLSYAEIQNDIFRFTLEIPMAVGTVGGLTTGHPLAALSLKILGQPSAQELMMIIAAAGIANNFSAVRSLITKGIQEGHMKMHLSNILIQLGVSEQLKKEAIAYFKDKTVSYSEVKRFVDAQTP